jgi:pimeloyl-ACP methyl ester carboxylesterase
LTITVPPLIIHGDDDRIVPIEASARAASLLIKNATLKIYPDPPHGLADTHNDEPKTDLLAFRKTLGSGYLQDYSIIRKIDHDKLKPEYKR